ncbi:unnamed protein product, partial [marine sediment metagenome]
MRMHGSDAPALALLLRKTELGEAYVWALAALV